ncbi:acidic leucine-rich nuclear phosphoprotein 32 family member A-like isoform X1 [Paramacrobiotus metropolitanus]|uniref:acidic leucine-rich nuclear phosphoprotein 32 family member A-like isoform X1 n=2 Tax=Paramacrobiotus metropolitanus TaxID=2943436 RepID=UPI002445EB6C|nr:acidic leucine-rich nuclear phosphoprotein 32 family member A-like isoform X1 [Paramacrobiotus metropolitanus]
MCSIQQAFSCVLFCYKNNHIFSESEMSAVSRSVMEAAFRNLFGKLSASTPEMVFDGKRVPPAVLPLFVKFQGLEKLSLIDCDLWSLEGLPRLPCLRILMLGDNHIDDLSILPQSCPNLEKLSIVGNKIGLRDELEPLTLLPKLRALDVEGNELCEIRGHDRWLADKFPNVTRFLITAYDVDSEDEESDDDISWFLSGEAMGDSDEDGYNGDDDDSHTDARVPEVITLD